MFRLLAIRSVVLPFLKLVWRLFVDGRVPVFTKIIPVLAVAYLISPFDIIADRIPLLGQFDDLIVVTLLLLLFIAASPGYVVADQTIERKLRDLQKKQGKDPDKDDDAGTIIAAEIKYIDEEDDHDEPDAEESEPDNDRK
jgi:uncharacterized membrane protein YkvA (DUF1232 family)